MSYKCHTSHENARSSTDHYRKIVLAQGVMIALIYQIYQGDRVLVWGAGRNLYNLAIMVCMVSNTLPPQVIS